MIFFEANALFKSNLMKKKSKGYLVSASSVKALLRKAKLIWSVYVNFMWSD